VVPLHLCATFWGTIQRRRLGSSWNSLRLQLGASKPTIPRAFAVVILSPFAPPAANGPERSEGAQGKLREESALRFLEPWFPRC
jgi:hypothetical protein